MSTGKKYLYYKSNEKNNKTEFIKKVLDYDKKEESYVVVSLKENTCKCSIALYDMVDYFVDKYNYEKSNEVDFNSAYKKAIEQFN